MPFMCLRTKVVFPEDYVEEWGRKYGIGLGPTPVSEALVNCYHDTVDLKAHPDKRMHSLAVCKAPIVYLTDKEVADRKLTIAILDYEDHAMEARGKMMREKQLKKSRVLPTLIGKVA